MNYNLRPQINIETPSGRARLNDTRWFILITFEDDIPKREMHEICDSRNTLSKHCGRYILNTSETILVLLGKKELAYLMELAIACIDKWSDSTDFKMTC